MPELRHRVKDPTFFMSPGDAENLGIADGEWTRLTTKTGTIMGRVFIRSSMPNGLVRVPHGWWKPEAEKGVGKLSGMWDVCDAIVTPDDDPELLDLEQGIPQMKGIPCSVVKLSDDEDAQLEEVYGPTANIPRGPEGKVLRSDNKPGDFMFDDVSDNGVEFEAIEPVSYTHLRAHET